MLLWISSSLYDLMTKKSACSYVVGKSGRLNWSVLILLVTFPLPPRAKFLTELPPDTNAPFALAVLGPWFCSLSESLTLFLFFNLSVLTQPFVFVFTLSKLFGYRNPLFAWLYAGNLATGEWRTETGAWKKNYKLIRIMYYKGDRVKPKEQEKVRLLCLFVLAGFSWHELMRPPIMVLNPSLLPS